MSVLTTPCPQNWGSFIFAISLSFPLTNFNYFSLLQPEMISAHTWNKIYNLTLTMFPHYLIKIFRSKYLHFLHTIFVNKVWIVWSSHSHWRSHSLVCGQLVTMIGFTVSHGVLEWGSGIKTHSLGGACIGDTGSELQQYCTHIELD